MTSLACRTEQIDRVWPCRCWSDFAFVSASSKFWKFLLFAVGFPAVIIAKINADIREAEHAEHFQRPEFIPYEHLRLRTKVSLLSCLVLYPVYCWGGIQTERIVKSFGIKEKVILRIFWSEKNNVINSYKKKVWLNIEELKRGIWVQISNYIFM